jgi:hypothetical protein
MHFSQLGLFTLLPLLAKAAAIDNVVARGTPKPSANTYQIQLYPGDLTWCLQQGGPGLEVASCNPVSSSMLFTMKKGNGNTRIKLAGPGTTTADDGTVSAFVERARFAILTLS